MIINYIEILTGPIRFSAGPPKIPLASGHLLRLKPVLIYYTLSHLYNFLNYILRFEMNLKFVFRQEKRKRQLPIRITYCRELTGSILVIWIRHFQTERTIEIDSKDLINAY